MLPSHLFVSDCDGGLYDTREPSWHIAGPIRADYRRTHTDIGTVRQLLATLRAGPYAWPGGYPLYFITSDGGALAFSTVRAELYRVVWSIRNRCNDGWRVVACGVNYEDGNLIDDHTGQRIKSAYGDELELEIDGDDELTLLPE